MMGNFLNRERIIAIICFAFASYIWIASGMFPESALDSVGPAKYPRLLAAIIGISAAVLFFTSNGPIKPIKGERKFGYLIYVLICAIVYLLLFSKIGFIAATTLFLLAMTLYFDKRDIKVKLKVAVPYSILFSIVLYIFFAKLLGVLLPSLVL